MSPHLASRKLCTKHHLVANEHVLTNACENDMSSSLSKKQFLCQASFFFQFCLRNSFVFSRLSHATKTVAKKKDMFIVGFAIFVYCRLYSLTSRSLLGLNSSLYPPSEIWAAWKTEIVFTSKRAWVSSGLCLFLLVLETRGKIQKKSLHKRMN